MPAAAVVFGQHAKDREFSQARTALLHPTLEVVTRPWTLRPQARERVHLEIEYSRAVDHPLRVERAPERGQRLEVGTEVGSSGCFFDAQIEWIHEAAARRVIRARLLRAQRQRRRQRVDEDRARAEACRPSAEPPQIGEITDAPRFRGARGIQLHGPTPCAARGNGASRGAHDQPDRRAVVARA